MEFKGTKGKWTVKETKKGHQKLSSEDWIDFCKILNVINVNNRWLEEARYNALLISKAPEMLEMLKELLSHYEDVVKGDYSPFALRSDIDKAKQLIKEATEL